MATLTKGKTFGATEEVTAAKLHSLVDNATISGIVAADITANTITDTQISSVSGSKLITLSGIPSGAGVIPAANLTSVAQKGANSDITAITGLTGDVYSVAWADYSATSTIVGWSVSPTKNIYVKKIGKTVFVQFDISGTSNATGVTFTVPYTITTPTGYFIFNAYDNGGTGAAAVGKFIAAGTTITLYKDANLGAWTNSGTKSVYGQFWYESA